MGPCCYSEQGQNYTGAYLQHGSRHGVGLIAFPFPAFLALPDVTLLAPVVQAIPPHAVAGELAGWLLLSTGLAHLQLRQSIMLMSTASATL